ncbi:hypothetical protein HMPREF9080_01717, partial [Cardiobacterium valvarum F0432]
MLRWYGGLKPTLRFKSPTSGINTGPAKRDKTEGGFARVALGQFFCCLTEAFWRDFEGAADFLGVGLDAVGFEQAVVVLYGGVVCGGEAARGFLVGVGDAGFLHGLFQAAF